MRLFILLLAFCAFYPYVNANHDWDGYHWHSNNLNLLVEDKTSSSLYDVNTVLTDWNNLNTPVHMSLSSNNPNIIVTEAYNPRWLGLARIYLENGHIIQGEVKMNTKLLLRYYGLPEAKHVLCQEIGHVIGLDHNRDGPSDGEPDNTCMNDIGHLGEYELPNVHDAETLNQLYNHSHDTSSTTTTTTNTDPTETPKPCGKNPNHPLCSRQNGWYAVHVVWFDPSKSGYYPEEVVNEQRCYTSGATLVHPNMLLIFIIAMIYLF